MGGRLDISVNPCKDGVRVRIQGGAEIEVCGSLESLIRRLKGCGYWGGVRGDLARHKWQKYLEREPAGTTQT